MHQFQQPQLGDSEIRYIAPQLGLSVDDLKMFAGWLAYFDQAVATTTIDQTPACPIAFLARTGSRSPTGYAPEYGTGIRMLTGAFGEGIEDRSGLVLPYLGGIQIMRLTTFASERGMSPITWLHHFQRVIEGCTPNAINAENIRKWIAELAYRPGECRLGVAEGNLTSICSTPITCFGWWVMS